MMRQAPTNAADLQRRLLRSALLVVVAGSLLLATAARAQNARSETVSGSEGPATATDVLYVSTPRSGQVADIHYRDGDVLAWDTATSTWSMVFDASAAGLSRRADVDALHVVATGGEIDQILLSFDRPLRIDGLRVDDSDIVLFDPDELGEGTTRGSFSMFFDGSANGLTRWTEDVDAISFTADGDLVLSTTGWAAVPGSEGGYFWSAPGDLIALTPDGGFRRVFDASDISRRWHGVDAVALTGPDSFLRSDHQRFAWRASNGDVQRFVGQLGDPTTGSFETFIEDLGLSSRGAALDALSIGTSTSNNAPSLTVAGPVTVAENTTAVIDLDATDDRDIEGGGLTYMISGADAGEFTIDADTGVISFLTAPDAEEPSDADLDGHYEFEIIVTDSGDLTAEATLVVDVVDVNEPPTLADPGPIETDENMVAVVDLDTDDPEDNEGEGLTYEIEPGLDGASFQVDPVTGVVIFADAPDFEEPFDEDGDNTYTVNVQVTDAGGLHASVGLQVAVQDVDDDPDPIVTIDSHIDDELVDIGTLGQVPTLSGIASPGLGDIVTVDVAVVGEETVAADLDPTDPANVRWSIPFGATEDGVVSFTITATDSNGGSATAEIDLDVRLPADDATIYAPGVSELGTEVIDTLADEGVTADLLTFTEDPGVAVGQVLLAAPSDQAPEGFSFVVLGVREEAGQWMIDVRQAQLDEIFSSVRIEVQGAEAAPVALTAQRFNANADFSIQRQLRLPTLNWGPDTIAAGPFSVTQEASVESTLDFVLDVETNWRVFPPRVGLREFRSVITGTASLETEYLFQLQGEGRATAVLFPQTTIWRTVIFIPGVPAPIPLELDAELELELNIQAELTARAGAIVAIPFQAGFERNAQGQVVPIADYDVSAFWNPSVETDAGGSVDAQLELIGSFDLDFFGGPFAYQRGLLGFDLNFAPGFTASIWQKSDSPGPCWNIDVGYRVTGGISAAFGFISTGEQELIREYNNVAQDRDTCLDEEERRRRRATSWGDPHLVTHDGLAYDFQGAGDYVLATTADGDWQIQARFTRPGDPTVSFNRAVAATVGDSILSFGDDATTEFGGLLVPRLDGEPIIVVGRVPLPGGAILLQGQNRYIVEWDDGTELEVSATTPGVISMYIPPARAGLVSGLFGDNDGDPEDDLRTATGELTDPTRPLEFYAEFGESWRRDASSSLFTTPLLAFDPNEVFPIYPTTFEQVADLDQVEVTEATNTCTDAGLQPGGGLVQCIFDIATTGDTRFITTDPVVLETLTPAVPVAALFTVTEDDITIPGPQVVTGELDGGSVRDIVRISLAAGEDVSATAAGCPSASTSTFRMVLLDPDGVAVAQSTGGCGGIEPFRVMGDGLHAFVLLDEGGFTGSYEIDITVATELGIDAQLFEVDLPVATGDTIGVVAVAATDPTDLVFSIEANPAVDIDASTGEITVRTAEALLFAGPTIGLDVTVQDGRGNEVTAGITIEVSTEVSPPPLFVTERFGTGARPLDTWVGDVTGDGVADVVAISQTESQLNLLPGVGDGQFDEARGVDVGDGPVALAGGDLNGDGLPDFVTANQSGQSLTVVLATPTNEPEATDVPIVGGQPTDVQIYDVVGDAAPDLIVSTVRLGTGTTDEVVILAGDGDGGFTEDRRVTVGRFPTSVAVGDVNDDDQLDIITADASDDTVTVVPGDGADWAAPFTLDVDLDANASDRPAQIELFDHRNDGDLDIYVLLERPGQNGAIVVFDHGTATETFQEFGPYETSVLPSDLTLADLEGDGIVDLIVANEIGNNVMLFNGLPGGGYVEDPVLFSESAFGSQRPLTVDARDVNGDFAPDLVIASSPFFGEISVILHTTLPFDLSQVYVEPFNQDADGSQDLVMADVTGDGRLDAISLLERQVIVYPGTADGFGNPRFATTRSTTVLGEWPVAVAVADVAGDDQMDLVTANRLSDTVSIIPQILLSFGSPTVLPVGDSPSAVAIGDVTGDGEDNIVVANSGDDTVSILTRNPNGEWAVTDTLDADGSRPTDMALADVTGDGLLDIVLTNADSESVDLLTIDPDGSDIEQMDCDDVDAPIDPETGDPVPVDCSPGSLEAADLNGDGFLDLVVTYPGVDRVNVVLSDENGELTDDEHVEVGGLTGTGPGVLDLADVDGDGSIDIVAAASGTAIWLNNGDGEFDDVRRFGIGGLVAAVDVTGDNRADIVTLGGTGGSGAGGSGNRLTFLTQR
ncbi:MAG: FG-GAP-like repeat-containing protein [Actinomycetota bacterium]